MAASTHQSSPGRLVVAGDGLMPPRLMLVPAGVSLPPGVHPVGLVARVASASAGLGLEDVGFGTTRAAAGGGLGFSCAALSGHHVLSSAGLGLEDVGFGTTRAAAGGGLGFSCAALSSLHVLSSASLGLEDVGFGTTRAAADGGRSLHVLSSNGLGLGFASAAGLGSSAASRTSLLVAAATPGSEAEGGDGDDSANAKRDHYEEIKQAVLLSWEWHYTDEDRSYQPLGFFGDGDVEALKESADKGRLLMRVLLHRGLDYTDSDMWALSYAGQCLRRVYAQAVHRGVVYDAAVIEASQAVERVCKRLLPRVTPSAEDPIAAYTKQRVEDFVDLIEDVESAVMDP